ncbi:MAG: T9SS type A sorting domain-containing protein, partial [Bacteroidetes bacterium]|nr:T9SS type A sorting domain-containing protein [Bacteroidota bacterium]
MQQVWSRYGRLIYTGILIVLLTGSARLNAQTLTVHVTDRTTDAPVGAAQVQLLRGTEVLASATTDGSGTATFDLAVSTEPTGVPRAFQVSAPYPNPTAGAVRFDAVLNAPDAHMGTAPLAVTVFDALGRRVLRGDWRLSPGTHAVDADLRGLAPGVYFVHLRQGPHEQVRAVVLNAHADGLPTVQVHRTSAATAAPQPLAKQAAPTAPLTVSVRKDGYAEHRLTRTFTGATTLTLGLEPVVDQAVATVGDAGGDVQLPDGVRLVVPPGGVQSGTAQIELSALHANPWFDAPHQRAIHVNVASGQVGALALHVPVASEEAAARTGVTFLADPDSVHTVYLTGSYDAAVGALIVPLAGTGGKTLQGQVNGVYLIEGAVEVALTHEARLLELPYYEQDGDNCWAAAWLMLLKSYAPSLSLDAIYELLHLRNVDKDAGLSWRDMRGLAPVTAGLIGHSVNELRWTNFDNFVAYVMQNV